MKKNDIKKEKNIKKDVNIVQYDIEYKIWV
jgi:hypothetical protein